VHGEGILRAGAMATVAFCCMTATAPAAEGLEPGVNRDPGSPAAKEYALPINQARQTGSKQTGSGSAALFGAGIKSSGSGGSGGRPNTSRGSSLHAVNANGSQRSASGAPTGVPGKTVPANVLRAAHTEVSGSGNSNDGSFLALLGGGVAILILGAFGGTVMRRSHRSSASTTVEPR
jgi:hypothetical protein